MRGSDALALEKRLNEHGYELYGVKQFRNHDRVTFGNSEVKISINLRGHLSELALDAIVNACIGKH